MVTMRVFNTENGTWIRAWVRQSYGSLQRPAYVKYLAIVRLWPLGAAVKRWLSPELCSANVVRGPNVRQMFWILSSFTPMTRANEGTVPFHTICFEKRVILLDASIRDSVVLKNQKSWLCNVLVHPATKQFQCFGILQNSSFLFCGCFRFKT